MKVYITDGSSPAFFTAVFDGFREECVITSTLQLQLGIENELIRVVADSEKNRRVQAGIERYDRDAVDDILLVLRSGEAAKEQTAFEYIKTLMYYKSPVKKRLSIPAVIEFNEMLSRVTLEAHRIKGFLRFMESRDGTLYAPYSPDNDITDLIMPHFAARLKAERFVIHDVKRKIAGMYDGKRWIMAPVGEAEVYLSEYEKAFENLWKKYYSAVNIESRAHEKQMKGYMPVRYWKFLPEKK